MDMGDGNFEMLDKNKVEKLPIEDSNNLFRVGEEVHIKDSRFRIMYIKPKKMLLKLLPKLK